jgi:hypothetical protein
VSFTAKDVRKEFEFLSEFNFCILPYDDNVSSDQLICYDNGSITLRIEQYHRDLYLLISEDRNSDFFDKKWYNICWIIMFLTNNHNFKINFFREVQDYEQCMRLQIRNLANIIKSNIEKILFFFENKYEAQRKKLDNFIMNELEADGLI